MNYTGRTVQKLEVLIEENAFGSVRPVQFVAEAPVSALVPALVEELKLPKTDLFGKKLTYILRRTDGSFIPEYSTLLSSGVVSGECLTLLSFAPEEMNWNTSYSAQPAMTANDDPALHSSATLTDLDMLPQRRDTSAHLPSVKKGRNWTRRAFLLLGSVAIGAAGTGIGYAAYRDYLRDVNLNQIMTRPQSAHTPAVSKPTPMPAQPATPTMAKLQTVFTRHQQLVRSVAWSPDGLLLASGADDAQVFIWGTDGAVHTNIDHPASVQSLAWSSDGKRLVTGSGTQLAFFNAQNGNRLARSTRRHTQMITSVAWATHGLMQVVSAGADRRAIVWNTTDYLPQTFYQLHTATIEALSWSADGQTIASSSQGGYVRVWTASNGMDVHGHYEDTTLPIRALAFSPSATQLAAGGDDGIIRLWNAQTCQNQQAQGINSICADIPQRLHVSTSAIRTLAWSHDGRFLAVGTNDGVLSVWDPGKPQQPLLKVQQKASVHSAAWSPDNKYLASASGNTVSIWLLV